jgi:hypothetical protein
MRSELVFGGLALVAVSAIGPSRPAAEPYGQQGGLLFERNAGQFAEAIRFAARGNGYRFALLDDRLVLALAAGGESARIAMRFGGAHRPPPRGEQSLAATMNYFVGRDPAGWRTGVPTFGRVRYAGADAGVDFVFYGNERQLEYDVVVAPGADARRARLTIEGADTLRVDPDGALILEVGGRELRYTKPVAYQMIDGERRVVEATYRVDGDDVAFDVGAYDRSRELVIDPVLVFSTYLGGAQSDIVYDVAVDAAGSTFVTGTTDSANFPVTAGVAQPSVAGAADAFVTKFRRDGSIVYSTFFGGGNFDVGLGIDVDPAGAAYVVGQTLSTDMPTSATAFQRMHRGEIDAFVFKLSPAGNNIAYATYLGGTGQDPYSGDVVVDTAGLATVVGGTGSADFPTTPGALMRTNPGGGVIGFATKLNATGSALVFSTLLTGTTQQRANAVALDSAGRAVIAGDVLGPMTTTTTIGPGGDADAFVLKLSGSGSGLVYSTRIGGTGAETAYAVALDTVDDSPHIAGTTASADFPTTGGVVQTTRKGPSDAFVVRFNPQGTSRSFSTLLGGSGADEAHGLAVGRFYITMFGMTNSTDFPLQRELQARLAGGEDAFVTRLTYGIEMPFSTYLGGRKSEFVQSGVVDGTGAATFGGFTYSSDFPTSHAAQSTNRSTASHNGFVARTAIFPRGVPGASDAVVHVADVSNLHGRWEVVGDASAAGGARLHNPNAGAPKLTTALASPVDYFEFTVDPLDNGPYTVWVRGRADGNLDTNDSVFIQFSNARNAADEADNERDYFKIGTTEGLAVNIEDCSGCGVHGWGWQDGGYGKRVPGPWLYFTNGLPTTVRVQRREDGISIDQIVIAKENRGNEPNFYYAPGYQKDDDTILPSHTPSGGTPAAGDIVLRAGVDGASLHGSWLKVADAAAAGGARLRNPDAAATKLAAPLASPTHYFDLAFDAKKEVGYRIWIRGKADADFWGNDSAYVQFSGSVTGLGAPMWRIGTGSATTYTLEDCSGCGLKNWGWNDNAYGAGALGPLVYFAADGRQTIRVQSREDGLSIDQIVLSPERYLAAAPGATKNDATIVAR